MSVQWRTMSFFPSLLNQEKTPPLLCKKRSSKLSKTRRIHPKSLRPRRLRRQRLRLKLPRLKMRLPPLRLRPRRACPRLMSFALMQWDQLSLLGLRMPTRSWMSCLTAIQFPRPRVAAMAGLLRCSTSPQAPNRARCSCQCVLKTISCFLSRPFLSRHFSCQSQLSNPKSRPNQMRQLHRQGPPRLQSRTRRLKIPPKRHPKHRL